MQTSTIAAAVVIAAVIAIALKLKGQGTKPVKGERFIPRQPVTTQEQKMFWRLTEAFPAPDTAIHCQMAFSALVTAPKGTPRGRFDKKRADFVLTDKAFKVTAIIELDDSTHKGREEADEDRAGILINAGYRLQRYKSIPSVNELHRDLPDIAKSDEKLTEALAIVAQYKAASEQAKATPIKN